MLRYSTIKIDMIQSQRKKVTRDENFYDYFSTQKLYFSCFFFIRKTKTVSAQLKILYVPKKDI